MAWVRLHDGALSHPKVIGIFDPRRPFDLWLWGLSYSQAHLTDGLLPSEAIPRGTGKAQTVLVDRGLWEPHQVGFQIHDYLEWNDSKEVVTRKRSEAKERMRNVRERSSRELLRGVGSSGSSREGVQGKPATALTGSLPREHLSHALCDDTFSRCVPTAVHAKLANLLKPRYDHDFERAKAALLAWYPTVWATLSTEFVMGDAFRFWQGRFDAQFATKAEPAAAVQKPRGCRHSPPCHTDADCTALRLAAERRPA